eukprot:2536595-Prorocentrum_lima.AAC.1
MTSSLVGSEMCIRDRPSRVHRPGHSQAGSQCSRVAALPKSTTTIGPQSPVSYTHLTLPTICSV